MAIAELTFLVIALAVLARSTNLVVDGAVKLADFFRIGHLAIGFVLVSTATSLPELMVSVISSGQGEGGIAVGNVFGSNIANVLFVLGLSAFLFNIRMQYKDWREITFLVLIVTIITVGMVLLSGLGRLEGIFLLLLYGVYIFHLLRKKTHGEFSNHVTRSRAGRAFLVFSLGILLILISAAFVVELAVSLADEMGLAKSFVGATVIALGTSLPELAVELQAVRQKKYGLALGDAVGSMATNLTLVLGAGALIHTIVLNLSIFLVFMAFSIFSNMLLFYFIVTSNQLGRREGILFLATYVFYLVIIFHVQLGEIA
ncbi:MAG TPA: sodium:calcium antiporter [Candidatus Bilamarchaeaceae archaeon]|nr:sodium:calcium antiporter [Candidatus Bilamarchaeaceae archaeon]